MIDFYLTFYKSDTISMSLYFVFLSVNVVISTPYVIVNPSMWPRYVITCHICIRLHRAPKVDIKVVSDNNINFYYQRSIYILNNSTWKNSMTKERSVTARLNGLWDFFYGHEVTDGQIHRLNITAFLSAFRPQKLFNGW